MEASAAQQRAGEGETTTRGMRLKEEAEIGGDNRIACNGAKPAVTDHAARASTRARSGPRAFRRAAASRTNERATTREERGDGATQNGTRRWDARVRRRRARGRMHREEGRRRDRGRRLAGRASGGHMVQRGWSRERRGDSRGG